jgi:integrase
MARIKLKYVHSYVDRHGVARFYFRRAGFKKMPLLGLPGSDEFMAGYQKALGNAPRIEIGAARVVSGSIDAAIAGYLSSAAFGNLSNCSKRVRRRILEQFRNDHGSKRVATLERRHIAVMLDAKTPSSARAFLVAIRALVRYTMSVGLREDDPTIGIKLPKVRSDGFYSWSEQDIAAFEARHPIGTKARLAVALLLYSAQRRADVLQLGRQHIRDGVLHIKQSKTGKSSAIPLHPELSVVLDATPGEHLTFLVSSLGRPFHPDRFTHWFADRCKEAGLPRRASVHGLRKAAARRLAEAGCSASVIAAVTGHGSLQEVQRYVAAADQVRLAQRGIEAIKGTRTG